MNVGLSRKKTVIAVVVLAGLISSSVLVVAYLNNLSESNLDVLNGYFVAVYFDRGVTAASRDACIAMLEWTGATVSVINEDHIHNGSLSMFDMLVMPGGCYCDERCQVLEQSDFEIIRDFISDGGAYLGIDGGAIYATEWRLDLFHGDFIADANGTGNFLLELDVNQDSIDPALSEQPATYTMFYEDSGYFQAENMTGVSVICTYQDTGYPCTLALHYGDGKVFLSSPHPEYEEGSLRDNTDYYDTLDDPDSEWDFMLKMCLWLLS
ncbi:MAG: BPL-N domain-containing protein [Candidatus Thorarchaeota archaeon]